MTNQSREFSSETSRREEIIILYKEPRELFGGFKRGTFYSVYLFLIYNSLYSGGLIFGGVFCLSDLSPLKLIKGKHSHRLNESNKKIVFKYT